MSRFLASVALAGSLAGCASTLRSEPPRDAQARPVPSPDIRPDTRPDDRPDRPDTRIDRAAVRAKLAARRAVVIERFLAYREARVYPMSRGLGPGFHHVWIDENGNLCAAATLVSRDWGRDAVIAAGRGNNGLKLADASSGALHDWILTSGLAHHEIVAIQVPGFEPELESPPQRDAEIARLYGIYVDVERQLRDFGAHSLELATDELVKRPELARALLAGELARPPRVAEIPPAAPAEPMPEPMPETAPEPPREFAKPVR